MRTFFLSKDLLDLVKKGYEEPENATGYEIVTAVQKNELKENRKKDSKALLALQQVVHESIFQGLLQLANPRMHAGAEPENFPWGGRYVK